MNKVLIMVMSHKSDIESFKVYKDVWEKIYTEEIGKNLDITFLYSDPNIFTDFLYDTPNLYSRCEENYWKSLLVKVINGLQYSLDKGYDYVFKTNLSTFVNVKLLSKYIDGLSTRDYVYDGQIGGYTGEYYYCSGSGMLLNKKTIQIILSNRNRIDESIDPNIYGNSEWTDDLFIGKVLHENNITPNTSLRRYDLINTGMVVDRDIAMNHEHIRVKVGSRSCVEHINHEIEYFNRLCNIFYDTKK